MTVHHFQPSIYYNAFGSYEPVLRLADGDMVITTTADATGLDASGKEVASGGNPLTGPFSVEGAEPGDSLALTFERLWPNRTTGWSSTVLAPNVVDPDYVSEMPLRRGSVRAEWALDLENGTATLVRPETRLGHLVLPLKPMLGCFGVAPPNRQAISSSTSGVHGGNMDYIGFTAGSTVYFPVFAPGGLVFVGDGHAVQGDAEICGTGIETSFDVEFTMKLLKGKKMGWPRSENEDYIMAVGNARPLDQALQHATTEMVRWLLDDFALDATAVHILLGQCVEYEVGNVFDPAYTVLCKLKKKTISSIK